jgi:hypothetical protein
MRRASLGNREKASCEVHRNRGNSRTSLYLAHATNVQIVERVLSVTASTVVNLKSLERNSADTCETYYTIIV